MQFPLLPRGEGARCPALNVAPLQSSLDKAKFGTHKSITCDGCGTVPLVGYRWRCKDCKNHDLCDACHEVFKGGKLPVLAEQVDTPAAGA